MLSRQTTLEPTTRRQPYVSYKQGGKPCLSLCKKTRRQPYVSYKQGGKPCLSLCKKTRRQPYVTYVAYVLMSSR